MAGSPVKMRCFFCLAVLSLFALGQCSGIEQTSALRRALLRGYDRDAKPDGQVEVQVGLTIATLDLDAADQVRNWISA